LREKKVLLWSRAIFFFGPGNREREMEVERRRMRRSLEL
jgi:hypothetical protein